MTMWETDDENGAAGHALPSPANTPYMTPRPSRRSSRQSSRRSISPRPLSSPAPPPLPTETPVNKRVSRDMSDEGISPLDPRRFTPTLHANLVAEILSLRREQDDKLRIIENLETTLHSVKTEQEDLKVQLATNSKESRSLKRQLALLEGGTASAMGELSKERDEAADNISDLKRRLELAQKKGRSHEENVDRLEKMFIKEKDDWDVERRKYETKVHAAEARLRTVIAEMEFEHLNAQNPQPRGEDNSVVMAGDTEAVDSDTDTVQSDSRADDARFSLLNGPSGYADARNVGSSLADELSFFDDDQTTDGGRDSMMSMHGRNPSQDSIIFLNKHRRGQSTDSMIQAAAQKRLENTREALKKLEDGVAEVEEQQSPPKISYVDTGIQYSPPPSPKIQATSLSEIKETESKVDIETAMHRDTEVEANQSRKRVHVSAPLPLEFGEAKGLHSSTMMQNQIDPLSPPRTPKTPTKDHSQPSTTSKAETNFSADPVSVSVATQTEIPDEVVSKRSAPPPPIAIPSISIHPPTSGPATPHDSVLPQHLKDAGCQVNMAVQTTMKDACVQTDTILVNERLKMLPEHLQPSAISSAPPSAPASPEPGFFYGNEEIEVPSTLPPRNPRRLSRNLDLQSSSPEQIKRYRHHQSFSLSEDDFDVDISKAPRTMSSLLAKYDGASSDDGDEFPDLEDERIFSTALSVPKHQSLLSKKAEKSSADPYESAMGLQERDAGLKVAHPKRSDKSARMLGIAPELDRSPITATFPERTSSARGQPMPLKVDTNVTKQPEIRHTALISSGIMAHQNAGPTSVGESQKAVVQPPFPIPKRESSRKPPFSKSAPNSAGQKTPTSRGNDSWGEYGNRNSARSLRRQRSVRKSRSAANLPGIRPGSRRQTSRSPPPSSPSTDVSYRSQLPPMPLNEITSPTFTQDFTRHNRYGSRKQRQHSATTVGTSATGSGSARSTTAVQSTNVVDAIAQTMIGEWMWKYVRRRRSFGVMGDGNQGDEATGNGARHRRWVWLAPYERAVMWSSKQPTSGSALMGKAGRKLTIQSVLDIPDANATPKGSGTPTLFNRSILILTPSRALKFTAPTKERHYVWMTALTFLAHSNQAVPALKPQPPPPSVDIEPIPPKKNAHLRKSGIRDSIRIAKGKTVLASTGPKSISSSGTTHFDDMHDHELYYNSQIEEEDEQSDAAEPPLVPRFVERGQHGRKRSNTGPKLGPRGLTRGFSGPAPTTADFLALSGQHYGAPSFQSTMSPTTSTPNYTHSVSGMSSVRSSETSSRPGNNFFEAVGTVRMEAFISPMTAFGRSDEIIDEYGEVSIKRPSAARKFAERDSRWRDRPRETTVAEDEFDHFRNF